MELGSLQLSPTWSKLVPELAKGLLWISLRSFSKISVATSVWVKRNGMTRIATCWIGSCVDDKINTLSEQVKPYTSSLILRDLTWSDGWSDCHHGLSDVLLGLTSAVVLRILRHLDGVSDKDRIVYIYRQPPGHVTFLPPTVGPLLAHARLHRRPLCDTCPWDASP
jgi:hypothetical protein